MLRSVLPLVGALLLVGCAEPQEPQPPAPPSPPTSGNPTHDALLRLPEVQRAAILKKAVTDSGERCDAVTRTFYQGVQEDSGDQMWNIACIDGGAFLIAISSNTESNGRILPCGFVKAVAQIDCFEKQ